MFRVVVAFLICVSPALASAQGQSTLRVTVRDETQAALIHAVVTLIAPTGAQGQALVDESGNATFGGLVPGVYQVRVEAEGFQGYTVPFTVKRGANSAIATLTVAIREEVIVKEQTAAERRDNGFTTILTADDIAGLSDDPDEMADQLMQMAGPGAQIFVDGFRGGRMPPKAPIQPIRFQTNSFAAEYHEAGMVRIEVITKPGMGNWRGSFNFGFRDESLNATNAFATERSPEQQKRFMFNSQGPIAKGKTSLSISADGNLSYDAQTIVAQTPDGEYRDQIRRPVDGVNATVRIEQAISPTSSLRAEYARRNSSRRNLGVGDFDLPERAYENETTNDMLRVRNTRTIGKRLFSELKVELSQSEQMLTSSSTAPTVRVLDAFTSGGAGQSGVRDGRLFSVAQNFDFSIAKHMLRAGAILESAWWDSTTAANTNGTFTFSSLADFEAGLASTFQRRVGDPDVEYSQHEAGWFVQDDFRITKKLTLSLGLRQEIQSNFDDKWNFAPRGAFTWAVGKGNVRGGYGIFYDWFEANTYEQTLRVDGEHQRDQIVVDPTYPTPSGSGTVLPPSRIELGPEQTQPTVHQASIGYDRAIGQWGNFRTDYMMLRGTHVLRSVNINAPVGGVRPDRLSGNINEIGADGERASDRFTVGMLLRVPNRRIMGNLMYQYGNARNSADSALSLPSNNLDPDADWGPAANDIRHRVFFMANTPLPYGIRASLQGQYSSAPPYNITTGTDDNNDTVFNDRPAGVGRNSVRGASQWNVNFRANRQFSLGGLRGDGPVMLGPPPPPPPSGNAQRAPTGGAGDGGGGGVQMIMDGNASRYRLDLYVQVFNLFNTTNLNQFVGNQLSTYFGTATSAAPPRRIEIGASLSF